MNPDALCLIGLACIAASMWILPPLGLAAAGITLVVIGVHNKRKGVHK